MAITLTENAVRQIRKQLAKRGAGFALRVGLKKVGCSGFAYTFAYADEVHPNDHVFETVIESDKACVVIDSGSLTFLDGSRIDYTREGLNDSFRIDNPNVGNTCGCGESFSLKETIEVNS